MARVSVVIPCYNQGHYLPEAVESVLKQTFDDYEIIIVNDGSNDDVTQQLLRSYNPSINTIVVHSNNQGLASARNNGIRVASGEYILPLDADDTIELQYLQKAINLLDNNDKVGIVYCRARLFGAVETEWLLPEYSLSEMVKDNVIFCSAMFRRSDWELVNGYDSGMVYGWEDYEFWISLIEKGRKVVQIPEILFNYRVASDSMVRSKEKWQKIAMLKRVYDRHQSFFSEHIETWLDVLLEAKEKYYTSRLYVDCGDGISDNQSVARKVVQGTRQIQFDLSSFKNIHAIRFDPIDVPAVVEIEQIEMINSKKLKKKISVSFDNAILKEGKKYYFSDCDSQCLLDLKPNKLRNLEQIVVKLNFSALESEALEKIIAIQSRNLQKLHEGFLEKVKLGIAKLFLGG